MEEHENIALQGAGEENGERLKMKSLYTKAYYFLDGQQGSEASRNILALMLPSEKIIFIKKRVNGKDQVLIPLKHSYIKLWKDSKDNILYNTTYIDSPLFTKLILLKDFNEEDAFTTSNEHSSSSYIDDYNANIKYEIRIYSEFFRDIADYLNDSLAFALYHLFVKPLI